MRSRRPLRGDGPRTGHAVRVAAVTTAAIGIVYLVCVTVVNLVLSAHLTAQTDSRLGDRLNDLRRQHVSDLSTVPDDGRDEGAPVVAWLVSAGRVVTQSAGAPSLPASVAASARNGQTVTVSLGQSGAYRLRQAADGPSLLMVGLSVANNQRIQHWLLIGEVTAGPAALLAMFAGALLIGLRAQAPVEESRRRQVEFTADASHELRTPLSVIQAETDLALASPRPAADYRDTLLRIREETTRLRRLTEDMLWLARVGSTPPHQDEGPVDLVTVAQACADRFRSVGPAVTTDIPVEPVLVNAPPEWIDRLTGVLLDNACRYAGPDGKVRISVTVAANRVSLTVEDSGPGIPADQRPRLFDRFSRATERSSGAGLGLAIGDSVVQATGGRWDVGDSPLGGARFAITWRHVQP